MYLISGKKYNALVTIDNLDNGTIAMLTKFINSPVCVANVASMPDAHVGKGCTVGFTMKSIGESGNFKIVPNIIGVDIGCGMISFKIGKNEENLEHLDKKIRNKIPFGQNIRSKIHKLASAENIDYIMRHNITETFIRLCESFGFSKKYVPEFINFEYLKNRMLVVGGNIERHMKSIGTLGGGNHFIEFSIADSDQNMWCTIHSGSRNFGKCVCDFWQKKAIENFKNINQNRRNEIVEEAKKLFTDGKISKNEIEKYILEQKKIECIDTKLDIELAWLSREDTIGYIFDMIIAQNFASWNRKAMMHDILEILDIKQKNTEYIETIHNYIDDNDMIIRKGAIRSYTNEKMIIPLNMKDGILICEGKSNPDWNFSAPHGAGRIMSRSQAKQQISVDTLKKDMNGIVCTNIGSGIIDEAPSAYKNADEIIDAIYPTAIIIDRLKPILAMKSN